MAALLALLLATTAEALQPTNLSVDYWAPSDVAAAKLAWVDAFASRGVRFSWQLSATAGVRGMAQAAYQLQVSGAGETTAWDSGVVQSNRTLHIGYSGDTPLGADARYRWRVQVTDSQGVASEFSPWQSIATALSPAEWEPSAWINGGSAGNQLRNEFFLDAELHAAMAHASLFYSGVGYGLAWLNGVAVAPEEALGPW